MKRTMTLTRRRPLILALAAASVIALAGAAGESVAQEAGYPRKPIRWVVPYAAGSPLDINIRKIADVTSRKLNGTIVIDNKGGAGGVIGATEVAKAAPDGYTFLATVGDPLIASTGVMKTVPYDSLRDFTFITKFSNGYTPVTIRSDLKIETLAQLVEAAKKQPIRYASIGAGSFPQLIMEELNRVAGIKIQEIAYRSPPQAAQALLTGEVDIYFASPTQAQEYVTQGKVHLLAAQSKSEMFPNVPSFAEAGYSTTILNTPLWLGLLGPARLPTQLVNLTLTALKSAYAEEELKAFFGITKTQIVLNSPAEFEREFRAEHAAVIPLIKALGIEPQ